MQALTTTAYNNLKCHNVNYTHMYGCVCDVTYNFNLLTLASSIAFLGMSILGKAYMAPCTGLQETPLIELNISVVILPFSASCPRTVSFCCKNQV